MNKFESVTKSLRWFIALLMVALVVGCGGGSSDTPAPLSAAKSITSFTIGGVVGTIDQTAKTVALTVPNATPVTAMIATFTVTGGSVSVGTPAVAQVSATTANDFTSPVTYIVTAADGSTASYVVTVTVAGLSDKAITAYSLNGATGTISGATSPFAIAVTVPNGTNVTAMVATFSTTGTGVAVAATPQTSGITANDFAAPLTYTVTAADNSTATYVVTVTVAASSAKAITSYSLGGVVGSITGASSPYAIAVTVPNGTNPVGLIATFVTTGSSVTVVATGTQVSATTANDFTNPVAYTVHAADSSTAIYNVTVSVAAAVSTTCTGAGVTCVPLGLADDFSILAQSTITDATTSFITGNIGLSPITGSLVTVPCASMLTGKVYQVDDAFADAACSMSGTAGGGVNKTYVDTAVANMGTAYTDAAGRAISVPADSLGTAGDISGLTLTPGVYKWTTAVQIQAGNPHGVAGGDTTGVTLDCTAGGSTSVFIFQISGTLTEGLPATPAQINLTGGCLASNIFWQATSDVTITPASVFNGNVLTATQVVMQAGAVLHGRALAQTAVTLIQNTVGP